MITKAQGLRMVGKGWASLIEKLYTLLKPEDISDIKEKYGQLSIYFYPQEDKVEKEVWKLEEMSAFICEVCGEKGELRNTGWIKCLCDKCNEKE